AGATKYQVFRTEGVFQCDFGKVKLGETTGTTWNDSSLQNGREYSYVVIPIGGADACMGPGSLCANVSPAAGPGVTVLTGTAVLTMTSGDGDDYLDNCENASMTFDVRNSGLGTLTNVRLVDVTPSNAGVVITSALPAAVSPSTLLEGQTGSASFTLTAEGLTTGETLTFQVEVTADQMTASHFADLTVLSTETDLTFVPSTTYSFETDTEGWTTIQGTFDRASDGGGAGGTTWYEQSSANLADQCDQIQSPVMVFSATTTLSLSNNYDIEPIYTNNEWYDRANVGIVDTTSTRTLVSPDGGRLYNAGGVNGTCGTSGQDGWADAATTWAASTFSAGALGSAGLAGEAVQLDVRYGTDALQHFYGFRFDEVTVTDVSFQGPDTQSDTCGSCDCTSDPECDDGNVCNGLETCDCTCQAGTPLTCDDGLWCNGAETCDAVLGCQAGSAPNCDDGVGCTDDSCNEGTDSCDNVANDGNCDNGLWCDGAETCDAVLDCQAGTDPCPGLGCDETGDVCTCLVNGDCDDGVFCNGAEVCNAGVCEAGTPPTCDDGVGCTDDSCNVGTDSCDNTPDDAQCDNGLFCDGAETCDVLLDCQAGGDPCLGLPCDEANDECICGARKDPCSTDADCCAGLSCHPKKNWCK
ncbi:MAG: hypothetical protein GY856_17750, partial [bacterium]|nr:hypothetical protein [bacterium]